MMPTSLDTVRAKISQITERIPWLKVLVLFGSRARGDYTAHSDWDFGILCDPDWQSNSNTGLQLWLSGWLIIQDVLELSDDDVEVFEIDRCPRLLAHAIAEDGVVLYEREVGEFDRFKSGALMSQAELNAFRLETRSKVLEALKQWGQLQEDTSRK